jgi:hypothetical protein
VADARIIIAGTGGDSANAGSNALDVGDVPSFVGYGRNVRGDAFGARRDAFDAGGGCGALTFARRPLARRVRDSVGL